MITWTAVDVNEPFGMDTVLMFVSVPLNCAQIDLQNENRQL